MAEKSDRFVFIGAAHDDVEASIWRDLLEKEGVAVYMKSSDPLAPLGVAPLPGSLQVFVHARDEKRARWLLGDPPLGGDPAARD
ncbi:MAG: DUF2007 domain-containing protein [Dehalococcoidia bacterium]|nr:DUF2007 domain-containing protein [Dehalococcoidia bacterium]